MNAIIRSVQEFLDTVQENTFDIFWKENVGVENVGSIFWTS